MRRSKPTATRAGLVIAPRCRHAPEPAETLTLDWYNAASGEHGTLTAQSHQQAWLALAEASRSTPGVLLLRADAVSHFHLAASRSIKRSEWPLLLEDLSLDDPHSLHLHMLARGREHLELIALSAAELQSWQTWSRYQGIELAGWSVGFLALPLPAEQASAATLIDGEHRLFKGRGEPVTPGGTASVQWLAWPHDWPTPPGWDERQWITPDEDAEPLTAAAETDAPDSRARSLRWYAHHLPAALPFNAAGKQRSRKSEGVLSNRPLRRFLIAAVLLVAINGVMTFVAHYQGSSLLDQRNNDALAARFIGEPPPPDEAFERLTARRQQLQQLSLRNQQVQSLTRQVTGLLEREEWQLSRLAVVNQQVTFGWQRLAPPAPVVISRARQQLGAMGEPEWSEANGELTLTLALDQQPLVSEESSP